MTDWSRVCCSRAATAAASPPWRAPTSSRIGPPISTPRSRTPPTRSSSTRPQRRGASPCWKRRSPPANTSIAKSRWPQPPHRGSPCCKRRGGRGVKHGVVEDKGQLPGLQKLAALARGGELGRIVGFRLEFGWWVFDGSEQPCQRPSWNYRAGGGGIILDMYPHWRYVIESTVGRIVRVA